MYNFFFFLEKWGWSYKYSRQCVEKRTITQQNKILFQSLFFAFCDLQRNGFVGVYGLSVLLWVIWGGLVLCKWAWRPINNPLWPYPCPLGWGEVRWFVWIRENRIENFWTFWCLLPKFKEVFLSFDFFFNSLFVISLVLRGFFFFFNISIFRMRRFESECLVWKCYKMSTN